VISIDRDLFPVSDQKTENTKKTGREDKRKGKNGKAVLAVLPGAAIYP